MMGRDKRTAAAAAALVIVTACAGGAGHVTGRSSSAYQGTSPGGGRTPGPQWIITAGSLPGLKAAGLPVAMLDADFDNPVSYTHLTLPTTERV